MFQVISLDSILIALLIAALVGIIVGVGAIVVSQVCKDKSKK